MISFEVGKAYYFETFGRYYTGLCVGMNGTEVFFDQQAWIADTGRATDFFRDGKAASMEIEIMGDGWSHQLPYIASRREWKFPLFTEQV